MTTQHPPVVVFIYNTARYLVRFRKELIRGFQAKGYCVVAIVPEDDVAFKLLNSWGVQCRELSFDSQRITPLGDAILFLRIYRILKEINPTIVFSFTIKPVIVGSIAARLAGVKVVASMIAGLGYAFSGAGVRRRLVRFIAQTLYKIALAKNTRVFFQNRDDLSFFIESRLVQPAQAFRVAGSGVDLNEFTDGRSTTGDHRPYFLMLSRMIKEKGVCEYVEASRIVRRKYNIDFYLAGEIDRNPNSISSEYLESCEREGAIKYLGHVEKVQDLLAGAIAFVLPTYYREGIPRTILEAMASGLPIITTDTPGCRETVVEGDNGYLISPKDPQMLADRMIRLIGDPAMQKSMGERSRQLAVLKYDVRRIADEIVNAVLQPHLGATSRPGYP